MGLNTAVYTVISGLKTTKEAINVISNNIVNVNNPNYTKRVAQLESVAIDGVAQGVKISSIIRNVDDFLVETIREQIPVLAEAEVTNKYNQKIRELFDKTTSETNLINKFQDFFSSAKVLANSPEFSALKIDVVNKANQLTDKLSTTAYNLHKLRYLADQEIAGSIKIVNNNLLELKNINASLEAASVVDIDVSALLEQRDRNLNSIANQLDIDVHYRSSGAVVINTANGKSLLDYSAYELSYSPAADINHFIDNNELNALSLNIKNSDNSKSYSVDLITSGTAQTNKVNSTIETILSAGKIKGLQKLRDVILPKAIEQLDNMAASFTEKFNKIHNTGAGFKAASELNSTRAITLAEARNFTGKVRIGVIDQDGKALTKNDGLTLKPLIIDFDQLKNTNQSQNITVKSIIDEINQHFYHDAIAAKANLGNLNQIKLINNFIDPSSGQLNFELELDNSSQLDANIEITSLNIDDSACLGLIGDLPEAVRVKAGDNGRIQLPTTVDFSGGAGGPYNIQLSLKVTDAAGNISNGTIEYSIDPTAPDIINKRYLPVAVYGEVKIIPAEDTSAYLKASLVDQNGLEINDQRSGFLKINTMNNQYSMAIDDLDSNELGLIRNDRSIANIAATNRGFSGFFELNDFFVRNNLVDSDNNSVIANSALNMKVRADIIKNPDLISLGKLIESPPISINQITGIVNAKANLNFNSNPVIGDKIIINEQLFTYVMSATADNQISIGSDLNTTLINTVAKLSASNSYNNDTVDLVNYTTNGIDSIDITHKIKGTIGNNFVISGNFATTGVSINNQPFTTTPLGNLTGGLDQNATILANSWGYELTIGSNEIIQKLANLDQLTVNFRQAGLLNASNDTFLGYLNSITSITMIEVNNATNNYNQQFILNKSLNMKLQSAAGVNLDYEQAELIKYQQSYMASAKSFTIIKELYDAILNII